MIPYGKHHLDQDDIDSVVSVLKSGILTQGPFVDKFEAEIASYVDAKYAVAVSSCTAGLHIAALAAGVGKGDEIITTPISFVASANCAIYAGGKATFSDINYETLNLDPSLLSRKLLNNNQIKAIVPVHYAGLPCDMITIKKIADEFGLLIIEDAAHALGARYVSGEMVGSCKDSLMTVFSLHPVKSISAGEGGVITTNNEGVYRKLLRLRSHGINKLNDDFVHHNRAIIDNKSALWYYEMQELGFHYRITDIQCALALSQLKKISQFIDRRRSLVKRYDAAFSNVLNIFPAQKDGREYSAHHLYPVKIDFQKINKDRNTLMSKLRSNGIITQVHYIPIPMHPYYERMGENIKDYPASMKYYEQALTIPLFYDLTDSDQDMIIDKVISSIA